MGIWPQQASLGWCTGGTGLGGSDGQQGVGGQLDERKGREALADGCCEPRVRGNGTHRVVADR